MSLDIVLQYFDACPNWKQADRELLQALGDLGIAATITYEKIATQAEAQDKTFRGSPTILLAGRDPFAKENSAIGLSCRVYRMGGKPSGSPGVDALRAALAPFKS